jgi:hypothetical protein
MTALSSTIPLNFFSWGVSIYFQRDDDENDDDEENDNNKFSFQQNNIMLFILGNINRTFIYFR